MTWAEHALAGDIVIAIGQISVTEKRQLDRLARAGSLRKWRGYWHPVTGGGFGVGPLKTCWGTPAALDSIA